MTGFELMTDDQRLEWQELEERSTHSDTMVFTAVDAISLAEYRALAERLAAEYRRDQAE